MWLYVTVWVFVCGCLCSSPKKTESEENSLATIENWPQTAPSATCPLSPSSVSHLSISECVKCCLCRHTLIHVHIYIHMYIDIDTRTGHGMRSKSIPNWPLIRCNPVYYSTPKIWHAIPKQQTQSTSWICSILLIVNICFENRRNGIPTPSRCLINWALQAMRVIPSTPE